MRETVQLHNHRPNSVCCCERNVPHITARLQPRAKTNESRHQRTPTRKGRETKRKKWEKHEEEDSKETIKGAVENTLDAVNTYGHSVTEK